MKILPFFTHSDNSTKNLDVTAVLVQAYQEPNRFYHNLGHIMSMRSIAQELGPRDPVAVDTAIWFHDAVYEPLAPDNEERSAGLAQDLLCNVFEPKRLDLILYLIMATKQHQVIDDYEHATRVRNDIGGWERDYDANVVIDADLSTLASWDGTYSIYAGLIRAEYITAGVSTKNFNKGRLEFLNSMLNKKRIMSRTQSDATARMNITQEIKQLELRHFTRRDGKNNVSLRLDT